MIWLRSFVPDRQAEKLPLIEDAADLLRITLAAPATVPPVTAPALREAVSRLATSLTAILPLLPPDHPLAAIAADLVRLRTVPDPALLAANTAIMRFLPQQLARLRLALGATAVTEADVPADLRADWMAPDGRPRLQVTPKSNVRGTAALHRFVAEVQQVAPGSAGSAVTIVRSADTVVAAFRVAAISAVIAITLILAVVCCAACWTWCWC